jgi:hypothetical protein
MVPLKRIGRRPNFLNCRCIKHADMIHDVKHGLVSFLLIVFVIYALTVINNFVGYTTFASCIERTFPATAPPLLSAYYMCFPSMNYACYTTAPPFNNIPYGEDGFMTADECDDKPL